MKKIVPNDEIFARIRVIGIGGSGKNAVNHMLTGGIRDVEFIVANTDAQDINSSNAKNKIHIGQTITRGLGTGMDVSLGEDSAEASKKELEDALKGADMLFITCGMGGGTGTGASPVVAKIAKDLGILTVAVVTTPFSFEGSKRKKLADEGIVKLSKNIDALLVIPNDNIIKQSDSTTSMAKAFAMSDNILSQAVKGMTDLILSSGEINVDFADVRATIKDAGIVLMGVGCAKGKDRSTLAVQQAMNSNMVDVSIKGAHRVLFSVACKNKNSITMQELKMIAEEITSSVDPDAKIIFGTSCDKTLSADEIRVTVIAGSFDYRDDSTSIIHNRSVNYTPISEDDRNNENIKSIDDSYEEDTPFFKILK